MVPARNQSRRQIRVRHHDQNPPAARARRCAWRTDRNTAPSLPSCPVAAQGYHQRLRRYHLATSRHRRWLGRAHQDRTQPQLIGGDHLQAPEQRVRSGVGAAESHANPPDQRSEQRKTSRRCAPAPSPESHPFPAIAGDVAEPIMASILPPGSESAAGRKPLKTTCTVSAAAIAPAADPQFRSAGPHRPRSHRGQPGDIEDGRFRVRPWARRRLPEYLQMQAKRWTGGHLIDVSKPGGEYVIDPGPRAFPKSPRIAKREQEWRPGPAEIWPNVRTGVLVLAVCLDLAGENAS